MGFYTCVEVSEVLRSIHVGFYTGIYVSEFNSRLPRPNSIKLLP